MPKTCNALVALVDYRQTSHTKGTHNSNETLASQAILSLALSLILLTWLAHRNNPHPIDSLIFDAHTKFNTLLSKQTETVEAAAQAYRKRRGRHPPPGLTNGSSSPNPTMQPL